MFVNKFVIFETAFQNSRWFLFILSEEKLLLKIRRSRLLQLEKMYIFGRETFFKSCAKTVGIEYLVFSVLLQWLGFNDRGVVIVLIPTFFSHESRGLFSYIFLNEYFVHHN